MSKFVEPIRNMRSRQTNTTLHGRSVFRPEDVTGHNVYKGYNTPGVGDAVDLMGKGEEPVFAIADGEQTVWRLGGTKKEVIYLEGEGWVAVYAHINAVHHSLPTAVTQGEVVGSLRPNVGPQPHLHFELWLGGKAVSAPASGTLRDRMVARLGLGQNDPAPGQPRLIVAKPAGDLPSMDGLAYNQVPSRWSHNLDSIEVDTAALASWLGRDATNLPEYEPIRQALADMGVNATFNLTQLHTLVDPRVYVFTE